MPTKGEMAQGECLCFRNRTLKHSLAELQGTITEWYMDFQNITEPGGICLKEIEKFCLKDNDSVSQISHPTALTSKIHYFLAQFSKYHFNILHST